MFSHVYKQTRRIYTLINIYAYLNIYMDNGPTMYVTLMFARALWTAVKMALANFVLRVTHLKMKYLTGY